MHGTLEARRYAMLAAMPKLPVLTLLLAMLIPRVASAQSDYVPPPSIEAGEIAVRWISGRYIMPVTCTLEDGSILTIEQSVVVRPTPERDSAMNTVRATFFGIDVDGAAHCYNLTDPRMLDRRGVLFFKLRSRRRPDMGVTDFRHLLKEGQVTFHISDGKITSRVIGEVDAEPEVVDYKAANATMTVRFVDPSEDAFKALQAVAPPDPQLSSRLRRLEFRVEHPDHGSFSAFLLDAWR